MTSKVVGRGISFDDVLLIPKYSDIRSRSEVSVHTNKFFHDLEVPVFTAPMRPVTDAIVAMEAAIHGGAGVIDRFQSPQHQRQVVQSINRNYLKGAALGVNQKDLEQRLDRLGDLAHFLFLDVAHANNILVEEALEIINDRVSDIQVDVIVGNFGFGYETYDRKVLEKCVDYGFHVKVGTGSGSACTTRLSTGIGVPQLTAIMNIREATDGHIGIVADGGIRTVADIAKAIAAGANAVMLGKLVAATNESPAKHTQWLGKEYYGSASLEGKNLYSASEDFVEGRTVYLQPSGSLKQLFKEVKEGLQSAFSYVGARDIDEFYELSQFIEVGNARNVNE